MSEGILSCKFWFLFTHLLCLKHECVWYHVFCVFKKCRWMVKAGSPKKNTLPLEHLVTVLIRCTSTIGPTVWPTNGKFKKNFYFFQRSKPQSFMNFTKFHRFIFPSPLNRQLVGKAVSLVMAVTCWKYQSVTWNCALWFITIVYKIVESFPRKASKQTSVRRGD